MIDLMPYKDQLPVRVRLRYGDEVDVVSYIPEKNGEQNSYPFVLSNNACVTEKGHYWSSTKPDPWDIVKILEDPPVSEEHIAPARTPIGVCLDLNNVIESSLNEMQWDASAENTVLWLQQWLA